MKEISKEMKKYQEASNNELIKEYQESLSILKQEGLSLLEKTTLKTKIENIQTKLLLENEGLIHFCCEKFNKTEEFEDAMQISRLVFLDAIKEFDFSKGYRFSTYFTNSIKYKFYQIGIQLNPFNRFKYNYNKIVNEADKDGKTLTAHEIAEKMHLDDCRFAEICHMVDPIELDAPHNNHEDFEYADLLSDRFTNVERTGIEHNTIDIIVEGIKKFLKGDQRTYVYEFYILNRDLTYISTKYQKSKQWVSRCIKVGIKKLSYQLLKNDLSDYYEKGERSIKY